MEAAKCRREKWKVASKNAGREIRKSCTQQNAGGEVVGKFCCVESDEGECGLGDYHLKPYPYTYFPSYAYFRNNNNIRNL